MKVIQLDENREAITEEPTHNTNMDSTQDYLRNVIEDLVNETEATEDHKLTANNAEFLINTTAEFVRRNVTKFVQGSKEHGDNFLTEVDHIDESYKEVCDLLNYICAIRHNNRQNDVRYRCGN
jgi:hypothetical protein